MSGTRTQAPRMQRRKPKRSPRQFLPILIFAGIYAATVVVWGAPLWPSLIYVGASLITFLVYAADKRAARSYGQRVSENTLLFLGFIGGWPGAIIAQQTLRHKTMKQPFRRRHWSTVVWNVAIFMFLVSPLGAKVIAALLAMVSSPAS